MTGEAHHVDAHGLHVDVEHPRRLGGVHHQQQAVLLGKAPDGPDIQQIPRQVGAVGADDAPCVGPQQAAEIVGVDAAPPIRRQEVHLHPLQPVQGPQHGIVFAVGGQHVVTGGEQPVDGDVQGLGGVAGEPHPLRSGAAQQPGQLLTGAIDDP